MIVRSWLVLLVACASAAAGSWESFALRKDGSIPVWTVAGPLPNASISSHGAQCVGYFKDYLEDAGGESKAVPSEGDQIVFGQQQTAVWKPAFSDPSGLLDYIDIFQVSNQTPGIAYAFCRLVADQPQEIQLKIRSNDSVRVWLDEVLIHDRHVGRTIDQEEDTVPVALANGDHRLLVKVGQSAGNWALLLRIVGADGRPVKAIRAAVSNQTPRTGKIAAASLTGSPVVLNTAAGPRQTIAVDISSGGLEHVTCRMNRAEWPRPHVFQLGDLPPGRHRLSFENPVLAGPGPVDVRLESASDTLELPNLALSLPRQWTVYLVQHVHTDIGYTRPQTEILPEHLRYIDYALDYCDLTDAYPDDARFRWTCEITWAVREYLKRRPPSQIERLKRRVAEGRIELAGMFLNMSEIATESAMAASLQPIRQIEKVLGAPVRTAMQDDVNGAAWCLADYFNGIGLKYLIMGINKTRSLLPFDMPTPFWWESPSGKRVLALRADHYHTGNKLKIHDANLATFQPALLNYLASLEQRDYPFDCVSVQYSGYHTDNSPPAMKECDLIRAWNEKYAWPKLRSAVAGEFPRYIEEHHAADLEVHRQAWPDWWTDGFGSAARETAAARQTHVAVDADQTLLAMAALLGGALSPTVTARAAVVQEHLLFYDEHTYGAAESISDPMAENSMVQWAEKSAYVWEAVKQAGMLREEALGVLQPFLARAATPTVTVFNTLNWQRSGLVQVFIDHEILPADRDFRIVDPVTDQAILAQPLRSRREGTYWALWATDVPALGYKSYRIEVRDGPRPRPPEASTEPNVLENAFFRIFVSPETGAVVGLVDKQTTIQLVDQNADWDVGQIFRETLANRRDFDRAAFQRKGLENVKLRPGSNGPIWKSVLVEGDLDGCAKPNGVRAEIRLYETEKRVEFHYAIRKQPVASSEAVYVAFPFALASDRTVYEAQGGIVQPGRDQIPGSASDWQTVQSFLAFRSAQGQIVWGSDQAPLVQLGDLNLGKWQPVTVIERPQVYSWVMNNYWFTNFRATQQGEFKWSYYLTFNDDVSNTAATRFGWSSRVPLIPRVLPPGTPTGAAPAQTVLRLDAPNIVLVSARPGLDPGSVILHLRELDGKQTTCRIGAPSSAATVQSMAEVNVLEKPLGPPAQSFVFAPYETQFIKLTLPAQDLAGQ